MESTIILTEKMLDEINNIPFNIKFDQQQHHKSHFRGKCGEIYLENGKYIINCNFCNENYIDCHLLLTHIYYEHFKLKPPDNIKHLVVSDSDQPNQPTPKQIIQNEFCVKDFKIEQINDTSEFNTKNHSEYEEPINMEKEIGILDRITETNNYNLEISEIPKKIKDKYGLYSCEYCTRSYIHYIHLKRHCLQHNYPDEYNLLPKSKKLCNDKSKYFDNIDDKLQYQFDQMKRKPDNDGKFYCEICTKKFAQFRYYRTHYLQVHQPHSNPYKCKYCPMTFIMRQSLILHERTHTGEKPFKCSYCPRAFALSQNLKRHIYIHLGEKPYKCSYCDMRFTQPNSKKSHERNIHTKERPHQCELCGKAYPRSTLLKEHRKRHTNTRPFECKICHRTYYDNAALKIHLNTHTGEKIYECAVCLKKFKNVNCLKGHRKLHMSIKKYQCTICNETFAQNAGLYSHMKLYHNNVMNTEDV